MRMVILVGLMVAFAGGVSGEAFAQNTTCKAQATEKKLAGAALNSFMKKVRDRRAEGVRYVGCGQEARWRCQGELHQEMRDRLGRRLTTKRCRQSD